MNHLSLFRLLFLSFSLMLQLSSLGQNTLPLRVGAGLHFKNHELYKGDSITMIVDTTGLGSRDFIWYDSIKGIELTAFRGQFIISYRACDVVFHNPVRHNQHISVCLKDSSGQVTHIAEWLDTLAYPDPDISSTIRDSKICATYSVSAYFKMHLPQDVFHTIRWDDQGVPLSQFDNHIHFYLKSDDKYHAIRMTAITYCGDTVIKQLPSFNYIPVQKILSFTGDTIAQRPSVGNKDTLWFNFSSEHTVRVEAAYYFGSCHYISQPNLQGDIMVVLDEYSSSGSIVLTAYSERCAPKQFKFPLKIINYTPLNSTTKASELEILSFPKQLQVRWNAATPLSQISIYSLQGQRIFQQKLNGQFLIEIPFHQPHGIYLLKFLSGNTEYFQKLVW